MSKQDTMSSAVNYSYVSENFFNATQKTFSNYNHVNNLTYSIWRKKNLFIYLFIKENVTINIIINIKLILFN